jgi:5,6-dimethylbenzimidazole synthase
MSEPDFTLEERAAVYRAIALRRDIRAEFLPDAVSHEVLLRLLGAAHQAPSVGLSQPWRFLVVRSLATRRAVHAAFMRANAEAAATYRAADEQRYRALRLAGILDAPVNLCITCDDAPLRGHGLGRQTMPETARYSTVCAIQNLWLAARAEGLGVGWVSILDPAELRTILSIPDRLTFIAYLCLGYVAEFPMLPDLERVGWESRSPLADVIDFEQYREQ